jgi:sigma-B regulation protein RsbU (phosphoserine phosphatase)
MNLKQINSQEQPIPNRLNVVLFQSSIEDHSLLIASQAAIKLQTNLLKSSIAYAQSISGNLILKTTLKHTLEILTQYTNTDEGSIFLIDEDGEIVESILARSPVTRDLKNSVISKVLEDGLAGWTLHHRQIGIIYDSVIDSRWVQLPDQPYIARSALAIPLIYGIEVLGIITLTHPQPNHFNEEIAMMMQYCMETIAAIIVNAQLHAKYRPLDLV